MKKYDIEFHHYSQMVEAETLGEAFVKARTMVDSDPNKIGFRILRSSDENGENTIWQDVRYQRGMEYEQPEVPDHVCDDECALGY